MKIHFLKDDALSALKINLSNNVSNYHLSTNEWIYNYFQGENPFVQFKTEVDDFVLNCSAEKEQGKSDVQNAIILYSAMRNITDTQATDERLWSGLCHGDLWYYLHERWNTNNDVVLKKEDIMTRYFFAHNKRRSLFTNTISKLWWLGRLTYNQQKADPFELTRYFEKDFSTKMLVIFSSNFMSSKNVSHGMLSALFELENEGFTLKDRAKREVYYEATRYLNILGGTTILDYLSSEEIKERVLKHLRNF